MVLQELEQLLFLIRQRLQKTHEVGFRDLRYLCLLHQQLHQLRLDLQQKELYPVLLKLLLRRYRLIHLILSYQLRRHHLCHLDFVHLDFLEEVKMGVRFLDLLFQMNLHLIPLVPLSQLRLFLLYRHLFLKMLIGWVKKLLQKQKGFLVNPHYLFHHYRLDLLLQQLVLLQKFL
jgi:hypothetical protein